MVCENRDRFVNRLRVGKDQHPDNARPGTAPINLVCSCRNLITNGFNFNFEKNNIPNTFEIFKNCLRILEECYRNRYGIRHRHVENLICVDFIVF